MPPYRPAVARLRPLLLAAVTFAVVVGSPRAAPPRSEDAPAAPAEGAAQVEPIVRTGGVAIGGREIAYVSTTGTLPLRLHEKEEQARVFFVAYEADGDREQRPITFVFNGGPGSSSVWLHLGAFGPKRVVMEGEAQPVPPGTLAANEWSLLDVTDLVFVDPVTTGFSRAADGQDPAQFHGYDEDVRAVGEFVRLYLTRFGRWASPKFLAGESYGTTRAAGLSEHLHDRLGIYLNGVVLVSSILNFGTAELDRGNDLAFALILPTYTAVAFHHQRLEPALQEDAARTQALAEEFALGPYAHALLQGASLPDEERARIVAEIARFTGLPADLIDRCDLRVSLGRFRAGLLRDQGLTVGRLDGRFVGRDYDAGGDRPEFDASYAAIQGVFTASLNRYVRAELGYETDLPYEILSGRVQPWSFGDAENRYLNAAEDLRQAMAQNPSLRVFVASGLHDLATPYFATRYTFDHLGRDRTLRDRVRIEHYPAGHMMYVDEPSLARLKQDLADFYRAALPPRR